MATTGTTTGSDFSGLNDMLKHVYTKAFENNVEADSEISDIFEKAEGFEVADGPDGKQINMGHVFSSGGGVGSMLEDDYLPTAQKPTTKQSYITIKQHAATVQLSGRALRRVKEGPAAFVSWAQEALPRKAQRLAFHLDRQWIGAGTGIIGRVNMGSPNATNLAIDSAYGIGGLEGVTNLLLRDDSLFFAAAAAGTTPRTDRSLVTQVDYVNSDINVDAIDGSLADNDYIFLGDANVNSSGAREAMGLEGMIDDGTVLPTLQGLARATYPELNSQVINASTFAASLGTLNEDILDYADSLCFERGNMGKPSHILVNRSGQRSFWKSLKGDRVLNDPKGDYQGGKAKLRMMLGDRLVEIRAARKVPASRCYGIDPRTIKRFRIGAGRWDDTDGSVWNRVTDGTGRKDAFYAVYIEEEERGIGDPAQSFKITNLLSV